MTKDKPAGADAEQALQTLDQLSQTIAVMAEVVDRLKRHLSKQLRRHEQQLEENSRQQISAISKKPRPAAPESARNTNADGVELEISTHRRRITRWPGRVIH